MSVAPRRFAFPIAWLLVLSTLRTTLAQPVRDFDRTLGGDSYEEQNAILRLPDGFLLGGNSRSAKGTGDVTAPMLGNYDFWVNRTDFDLNSIWDKAFGGSGEDWLRAMIPVSDGGFIAAGYSNSGVSGTKTEACRGDYDFWIVRFDEDGNQLWDKTFGGTGDDEAYSILEMPDRSGFVVAGFSNSGKSPDKSEDGRGDLDFWLIRVDNAGQKIWDKTLGGPGREQFHSMVWAADGSLVLGGGTSSPPGSGEIGIDPARGSVDFWLVKFGVENQQVAWSHRYGGSAEDFAYSLIERQKTGNFLLGGTTKSPGISGGNCGNCKRSEFFGDRDFWLVETDSDGRMLREWSFGGTGLDVLYQIKETLFGQVLVAGVSDSPTSGNKTSPNLGDYDFWTIFLDKAGHKSWEKAWGGSGPDALTKVLQNPDGSWLLAGHSESNADSIKTEDSRGLNDFWLLKTRCDLKGKIAAHSVEKCSGTPVNLDGTVPNCPTCDYLWTNGQTGPSLTVEPPTRDTFRLLAEDWLGCLAADSMPVEVGIKPDFDLGRDTVIFTGQTFQVGVENPDAQFNWNTGDTTNFITISQSGIYVLTVTEPTGCSKRDYFRVKVKAARAVFVPNIITPDFDGTNDYFFPYVDRTVVRILKFRVFDRWGTQLFEKENIPPYYAPDGWDGTYRNRRVAADTYFYLIELLFDDRGCGAFQRLADRGFSQFLQHFFRGPASFYFCANYGGKSSFRSCHTILFHAFHFSADRPVCPARHAFFESRFRRAHVRFAAWPPALPFETHTNQHYSMRLPHQLLAFACLLFAAKTWAQPQREWDRSLGGAGWDELHFTIKTPDGGFLSGGNAAGQGGGDISLPLNGAADWWLVKTDKNGNKIWDKTFGGSEEDKLWETRPLPDGGWLLAGHSASPKSGSKETDGYGKQDFWLVRLDSNFNKTWEKTIGGSGDDYLFSLTPCQNGDFLLAGFSDSPADGAKTTAPLGGTDWWVVRMTLAGEIVWQKGYGGAGLDNLYSVVPLASGGFLLGGSTDSEAGPGGSPSLPARGMVDFWVMEIAGDGEPVRDRRFGGAERDQLQQILPLKDGNFLLLGGSASKKEGDRTAETFGSFDDWVIKIRPDLSEIWQKSYGGSGFDHLYRGLESLDGSLLLAGTSDSPVGGSHTSQGFGNYDFWLVFADSTGKMRWNKSWGGSEIDAVTDVLQTDDDGSILLSGHSMSGVGGVHTLPTKGLNDIWLLKTSCKIADGLPPDALQCAREPLPLDAALTGCSGGDCKIWWQNGTTTEAMTYVPPDTSAFFGFLAIDGNACFLRDSIWVETLETPALELGPDSTLFLDETWMKNVATPGAVTYGWSTGSALPTIEVATEQTVSVMVTGANGCIARDTVHICPCKPRNVYIPNVFTPDKNLYNDIFYVFADPAAVTEIASMSVFDRQGHPVFLKEHFPPNDPAFGWNGNYRGRRLDPGVFIYDVRVLMGNGKLVPFIGTVTLIR